MANNNEGHESRNDVKRPRRGYSAEEKQLLDETVKPGRAYRRWLDATTSPRAFAP